MCSKKPGVELYLFARLCCADLLNIATPQQPKVDAPCQTFSRSFVGFSSTSFPVNIRSCVILVISTLDFC